MVKKNTCVFISGQGSNLKNLITRSRDNTFPINIKLIISNNKNAKGLDYAKKYSIRDINTIMRMFLMGHVSIGNTQVFRQLFINNDSLLWNRTFSGDRVNSKVLYSSLQLLDAKYMVVGHTPQEYGINARCKNRIWRIDSMMSEAFGVRRSDNRIQVLEILNDGQSITII